MSVFGIRSLESEVDEVSWGPSHYWPLNVKYAARDDFGDHRNRIVLIYRYLVSQVFLILRLTKLVL